MDVHAEHLCKHQRTAYLRDCGEDTRVNLCIEKYARVDFPVVIEYVSSSNIRRRVILDMGYEHVLAELEILREIHAMLDCVVTLKRITRRESDSVTDAHIG